MEHKTNSTVKREVSAVEKECQCDVQFWQCFAALKPQTLNTLTAGAHHCGSFQDRELHDSCSKPPARCRRLTAHFNLDSGLGPSKTRRRASARKGERKFSARGRATYY